MKINEMAMKYFDEKRGNSLKGNTKNQYLTRYNHLKEYLSNKNITTHDEITALVLDRYIIDLNKSDIGNAAKYQTYYFLRSFFKYFVSLTEITIDRRILDIIPKPPKPSNKLPDTIDEAEFEILMGLIDNYSEDPEIRLQFYLYNDLISTDEIRNLRPEDIDIKNKTVNIRSRKNPKVSVLTRVTDATLNCLYYNNDKLFKHCSLGKIRTRNAIILKLAHDNGLLMKHKTFNYTLVKNTYMDSLCASAAEKKHTPDQIATATGNSMSQQFLYKYQQMAS